MRQTVKPTAATGAGDSAHGNWLDRAMVLENMDDYSPDAPALHADKLEKIRKGASDPSLLDLPTTG